MTYLGNSNVWKILHDEMLDLLFDGEIRESNTMGREIAKMNR